MGRFVTTIAGSCLGFVICFSPSQLAAEPMTLDVNLSLKDEIRFDFKDDSQHFILLTEREGHAAGGGDLAGAKVVEYGMHDVTRGEGGKASGYLEATTTEGDIAYFRWHLRAFFVAGPDNKVKVIDKL